MNKKLIKLCSLILVLALVFAGCANGNEKADENLKEESAESETTAPSEEVPIEKPEENSSEAEKEEPLLYIGYGYEKDDFKTYPADIEGDMTAEKLIAAIEELTGWNLKLTDEVTSGKGGMTVVFSPECAILTGPPMEQKEEFFVYDNESLCRIILESVKKTLQMNFVAEPGDPDLLDIYFALEGDKDIVVPNTGFTIPMDKPYTWENVIIGTPE